MNLSIARKFLMGALAAATLTAAAHANPIQVTLYDAGNPADIASSVTIGNSTKNNVYIGPYTLEINGQFLQAMCIDFNIASVVGTTYSANVTTIGSSNLANTYAPSQAQMYQEEAYLFNQITQTGADRTAIQEAAWDISNFNITSDINVLSFFADNIGSITVAGYINGAVDNYSSMTGQYQVISDVVKGGEQEFITNALPSSVTPEPSSLMLSLAPALAMGAEAVRRRRAKATV
jgi:hypothetical protein